MCPLSTVQYTCVAENVLIWRELGSSTPVTYTTLSLLNDTGMAGVFSTILTDINGTTLTSTATIDSVNLQVDNGTLPAIGGHGENFPYTSSIFSVYVVVENVWTPLSASFSRLLQR